MLHLKDLKARYQAHPEKTALAEALVKVNLGVGSPDEQRLIASFLKGSPYLAKQGELEPLIHYLNMEDTQEMDAEELEESLSGKGPRPNTDPKMVFMDDDMPVYEEDLVPTDTIAKEKIKK